MFKSIFIFMKLLLITTICTEVKKTSDSIAWKKKGTVQNNVWMTAATPPLNFILSFLCRIVPSFAYHSILMKVALPGPPKRNCLCYIHFPCNYCTIIYFSQKEPDKQHTIFNLPVETLMNNDVRTSQ